MRTALRRGAAALGAAALALIATTGTALATDQRSYAGGTFAAVQAPASEPTGDDPGLITEITFPKLSAASHDHGPENFQTKHVTD